MNLINTLCTTCTMHYTYLWGWGFYSKSILLLFRPLEKVNLQGVRWVSMETWGVSLAWVQVNRLGVGGNYVCYFVIVDTFMQRDKGV